MILFYSVIFKHIDFVTALFTLPVGNCSKLTIETVEQRVKYVQS